ncbi:cytochrome-c oxidase, cbb3-type subunit III [Pacificimonas flava]|uniref:Cbb3-type cytochrome c oxidase subunit n=2 Tax=Pacificimonas TaxID=1960290 RepID=A0A219B0L0_9SPHN|nr:MULTISPECIES: cytochrome-c oxidase, cbb3-type subunit III [Pacificimonas]MBZ6379639.1 cytochrome-c oxidase, cbb3-type subunit III [Pacificimonas aurantium]OWV31892.1 cytochrome-c oxidase, cbb3-type subunit III [Pacificimonas flava]
MADTKKRIDEPTGTETVGHEWDGIEELNTPLPRWWLWTFYATIIWALVYTVFYPAWPGIAGYTKGLLGWSSEEELAEEMAEEAERRAPILEAIAATPIERLPEDSELLRFAQVGGESLFKNYCVQCHGTGAAGGKGYPNLNDDEWLWGGDMKAIQYTLEHGIRNPDHDETRFSMMPAFGRDGLLSEEEIADVTAHVRVISGQADPSEAAVRGAEIFGQQCAVCHGPEGAGDREQGAPNLTDAIWLYGGDTETIRQTVRNSRYGVMPRFGARLNPVEIKMLTAYVHSRGGGEDFVEVAENPETEVDERP